MLIKEVILITGDLAGCRAFYGAKMGFPAQESGESQVSFEVGTGVLTFREVADYKPLYHLAFSVPNNMLDVAQEWLRDKTTILPYTDKTLVADFTNWNARAFYFRDQDGNILECITHYDRNDFVEGPFTKDCFTAIMEIGIPVEDVTMACENLHASYGIPYFLKGPRLKDFSVMGDEDGMLIVTRTGRGWLPTQEPALAFPLKVVMEEKGKTITVEI